MKKLMLLGGSSQQIIAIETAKRLGYYTVLCDYLTDNPGQKYADKFYLKSTTDKEEILEVAKEEKIDGIIAYASDPAAPTAAYVAEKLGLTTNPFESVDILCNKDKFRNFLKVNKFNTPLAKGYYNLEEASSDFEKFRLPVIIKPVDSSGSKGAIVIDDKSELKHAFNFALSYSKIKRVIIEEFIEKKHKYLIGGDIFILNKKVILWGLLNCHRDKSVNQLVPVGKSYPLDLNDDDILNVKNTLQDIVDKLNIMNGAMNVELIIDKNNNVWPIDIGPRNGGNMIPELLGYIFNINIVEMSLKIAMGENINIKINEQNFFYATHNLHSNKNGKLKNIEFSDIISSSIIKKFIYSDCGDKVEYFDNSSKALGVIFMKFENKDEMFETLENIEEHIKILVEQGD